MQLVHRPSADRGDQISVVWDYVSVVQYAQVARCFALKIEQHRVYTYAYSAKVKEFALLALSINQIVNTGKTSARKARV